VVWSELVGCHQLQDTEWETAAGGKSVPGHSERRRLRPPGGHLRHLGPGRSGPQQGLEHQKMKASHPEKTPQMQGHEVQVERRTPWISGSGGSRQVRTRSHSPRTVCSRRGRWVTGFRFSSGAPATPATIHLLRRGSLRARRSSIGRVPVDSRRFRGAGQAASAGLKTRRFLVDFHHRPFSPFSAPGCGRRDCQAVWVHESGARAFGQGVLRPAVCARGRRHRFRAAPLRCPGAGRGVAR